MIGLPVQGVSRATRGRMELPRSSLGEAARSGHKCTAPTLQMPWWRGGKAAAHRSVPRMSRALVPLTLLLSVALRSALMPAIAGPLLADDLETCRNRQADAGVRLSACENLLGG